MTNKEIVQAWFKAIDKKNYETLKNLMASNHSFRNPMTPAPTGAEQHLGMIQMMNSAFSGEHRLETIIGEGDWVSVSGTWSGTHTGEFNGIAATGNQVSFTFTDMMQVIDGKISTEYFEMNPMAIMQQVNSVEA